MEPYIPVLAGILFGHIVTYSILGALMLSPHADKDNR